MTFRTDRLFLRPPEIGEAEAVFAMDHDPKVMRYLGGPSGTLESAREWVSRERDYSRGTGYWVAEEAAGFVGWFHLRPEKEGPFEMELGFRLRRAAWGLGYGTEGSRALLDHAWGPLGCASVMATTDVANLASRRVMEKLGMRHVGDFLYDGVLPLVRYQTLRP